jgi:hypothetical protein
LVTAAPPYPRTGASKSVETAHGAGAAAGSGGGGGGDETTTFGFGSEGEETTDDEDDKPAAQRTALVTDIVRPTLDKEQPRATETAAPKGGQVWPGFQSARDRAQKFEGSLAKKDSKVSPPPPPKADESRESAENAKQRRESELQEIEDSRRKQREQWADETLLKEKANEERLARAKQEVESRAEARRKFKEEQRRNREQEEKDKKARMAASVMAATRDDFDNGQEDGEYDLLQDALLEEQKAQHAQREEEERLERENSQNVSV